LNIAFHTCLDKVGIQLDPNVSIQPDSLEYNMVDTDYILILMWISH
jgi:hypothetical protein